MCNGNQIHYECFHINTFRIYIYYVGKVIGIDKVLKKGLTIDQRHNKIGRTTLFDKAISCQIRDTCC